MADAPRNQEPNGKGGAALPLAPPSAHPAFEPGRIGALALRNRIIKTATFEGMTPGGVPSSALVAHHAALAAGGVAMTTVAYCAVSPEGRTFKDQLLMSAENSLALRPLTDAVHREGAAASLQIGHCGFFTKNRALGRAPLSASRTFNAYGVLSGLPFSSAMSESDMERTAADFGRAARQASEAGFDAVEVHLGHGYLLSQFLSPSVNRRRDAYGGSIENRLRFPRQVLGRVLEAVGERLAVLAKINLSDGFRGGLELEDAVTVAKTLESDGVQALVLSGGFTSKTPLYLLRGGRPLSAMIAVEKSRTQRLALRLFGPSIVRAYPFEELFFLPMARHVRRATSLPLVLLGGAVSLENLDTAMREGFDFVAMGRALIADPALVTDMQSGKKTRTRCNNCNACIAEMDAGGVRCVLDGPRTPELGTS
ncbi:MAG TPA: NADH:flavin oxidoreductase [Polyangiaceae bacterium]|nr:NADH:flavin oxidoreductase [Polyangiaceae bacterium]